MCSTSAALDQGFAVEEPTFETEAFDFEAQDSFAPGTSIPSALMPPPDHPARYRIDDEPDVAQVPVEDSLVDASPDADASVASLWERMRSGFLLGELPSPLVKNWENWYASRPDYVSRMIARGGRYLFYIVEEVEKRGMPVEIALLPMIESAYNPSAYSRAHAAGIWQFIPSTGKTYGLKQNWWQDERRDVLAATRAALDYLENLYEMFGSWELALASYNWGEGAVGRAIQRNESRGMSADYLSLEMPDETRNYLPKLLAVRNLIARPESYGLTLEDVPNRPYFEVVITEHNIDVKLAAQFAEISVEDFRALNPSHNRPVIRAERGQPILLPADRVERFHSNREAHNEPLVSWRSYQIGRRDTLKKISRRFGIAPAKLKTVNGLTARSHKLTGLTILVPTTDEKSAGDIAAAGFAIPLVPDKHVNTSTIKYVVKSGESLWRIARRFGVRVAQLAKQNGIRNGRLLAGQTLTIR
jgi:membrane-bound lytic murein transglycosylase D